GEAGPAAAGFELVRRGEERLARDDVDIDPGLVVVKIFPGARALGGALLGHPVLLGGEALNRLGVLAVIRHGVLRLACAFLGCPEYRTPRAIVSGGLLHGFVRREGSTRRHGGCTETTEWGEPSAASLAQPAPAKK